MVLLLCFMSRCPPHPRASQEGLWKVIGLWGLIIHWLVGCGIWLEKVGHRGRSLEGFLSLPQLLPGLSISCHHRAMSSYSSPSLSTTLPWLGARWHCATQSWNHWNRSQVNISSFKPRVLGVVFSNKKVTKMCVRVCVFVYTLYSLCA